MFLKTTKATDRKRLFFDMKPFYLAAAGELKPKGLNFKAVYQGKFALSLGMPFVLFQETLQKTHFQETLNMLGNVCPSFFQ